MCVIVKIGMSFVYVSESGVVIGVEKNRLTLKYRDGMMRSLPIETVDGIVVIGKSQLTSQCIVRYMEDGVPVSFFSKGGRYFGRLMSTGHTKASLQRRQSSLYDTDFSLQLAKIIIREKINNHIVVLRRYSRNNNIDVKEYIHSMKNSRHKIDEAESVDRIIGYEGNAAKEYYEGLSECIDERFRFRGRSYLQKLSI